MLSGIRTGKKKKRKTTDESQSTARKSDEPPDMNERQNESSKKPRSAPAPTGDNLSVAQQLKQQLASGASIAASANSSHRETDRLSRLTSAMSTAVTDQTTGTAANEDKDTVYLTGAAAATLSDRPDYQPEDFRHGSRRGKLKRPPKVDVAGTTQTESDQSIQEMLREERNNTRSMDEVYARNVARVGSRYKGTDFGGSSSRTGADEEDQQVDMTMFSAKQDNLTTVARQQKERSRQLAQFDKEASLTKRFWWWIESPSFSKTSLLALGNHVSMIMTPAHLSLVPGEQVYLVPIKHADSLVNCEDDVWSEIVQFQNSLRSMYAKEGKDVLFLETVLPSSKGLWQTKMEAIPVPERQAHDAPMYFKSALTEQAEEWGTHTKLLSTRDKGLRRVVPKKFPYFYVEWAQGGDGYAQIIETSSFPKDFGVDTVAGMMQMDPLRFRARQKTSSEAERKLILDFVAKWKPFDWTLELD